VEGCVILVVALVLVATGLPALTYAQTCAVLFVIGLLFGSVKFKSQEK
jgi:hypothetical protein